MTARIAVELAPAEAAAFVEAIALPLQEGSAAALPEPQSAAAAAAAVAEAAFREPLVLAELFSPAPQLGVETRRIPPGALELAPPLPVAPLALKELEEPAFLVRHAAVEQLAAVPLVAVEPDSVDLRHRVVPVALHFDLPF